MGLVEEHAEFQQALIDGGLLVPMGRDGLYGRTGAFEDIVEALDALVVRRAADQHATRLRFPPVFAQQAFEHTDYIASFPNLTGAIFTFDGDDRDHARLLARRDAGEDWSTELTPAHSMLTSAACHPLYQTLSGQQLDDGARFDVLGYCFRHEPAIDPARLQAFRMHELVYVGTPVGAEAHRAEWVDRGLAILTELGLDAKPVAANDPFFGRVGRMLAANQRDQDLKTELVVKLYPSSEEGTAVASGNYHQDHFGLPFAIESGGQVAHSACFGFGLERITLALLRTHGFDPDGWPAPARALLWP